MKATALSAYSTNGAKAPAAASAAACAATRRTKLLMADAQRLYANTAAGGEAVETGIAGIGEARSHQVYSTECTRCECASSLSPFL